MVCDSRFNYLTDDEPGEANSDRSGAQVIRQSGATVITIGRNNFTPRYTNAKRYQTIQSLSYMRGNHTFKIGARHQHRTHRQFLPRQLFSGSYRFNSLADFAARRPAFAFTQGFAGADTDGALDHAEHQRVSRFFVQDSWRVTDRLTLNYGYRYDLMRYAQPQVLNPDAGLAAAGLRHQLHQHRHEQPRAAHSASPIASTAKAST